MDSFIFDIRFWGSLILQFVTMFFCCVLPHCAYSTIYISILLLMGISVVSTQFEAPVWTVLLPVYLFHMFWWTYAYISYGIYISHLIFKLKWKVLCRWFLTLLIQQSTPSTLSCIKCLFLLISHLFAFGSFLRYIWVLWYLSLGKLIHLLPLIWQ